MPIRTSLHCLTALLPALISLALPAHGQESSEIQTLAALDDDAWEEDSWSDSGISADIPVVLTATRLRQSQLDTPASVTIIEAELIERMGVRNIEEIFRMVPGMLVANDGVHGGKQTTVTYHGTQVAEHRRLQVLIDGRSVYKPALPSVPRVSWTDLPLAVEDIQRIEVIRGPNSAAYGANSYLAIINILTKKPEDVDGHRAKITQGTNGIHDYYVNTSGAFAGTDYRLTVSGKADKGFDEVDDKDFGIIHHRDSRVLDQVNLRTNTAWGANLHQEFQVGYKTGTNQQRSTEKTIVYVTPQDLDVTDAFGWTRIGHQLSSNHSIQYQAYYQFTEREQEWRTCLGLVLAALNVLPGATAQEDFCANANLDGQEKRIDFEVQDTFTWNDALRTVAGGRWRKEEVESETYLGDDPFVNTTQSLFANIEYKLSDYSILNIGGSWEDDSNTKDFLAPRAAFNQHIGENQVVRFIYSEAVRSPNIYELDGQEVYQFREVEIFGVAQADTELPVVASKNLELSHERIKSHEISYFGLLDDGHWQFDVKWFYDELKDLISEPLGSNDTTLTNETAMVLEGIETQVKWTPIPSDEIYMSYAYINTKDEKASSEYEDSADVELRLSAQHSGSATWLHQWSSMTSSAVSYFLIDRWNNTRNYNFKRIDANLSHELSVTEDVDLRLSATVEYRIDDDPLLWKENLYKSKEKYFVSAELKF